MQMLLKFQLVLSFPHCSACRIDGGRANPKSVTLDPASVHVTYEGSNQTQVTGTFRVHAGVPAHYETCAIDFFGACVFCDTVCDNVLQFDSIVVMTVTMQFFITPTTQEFAIRTVGNTVNFVNPT